MRSFSLGIHCKIASMIFMKVRDGDGQMAAVFI